MMKTKKWLPGMLMMTGVLALGINVSAANVQKDHIAFSRCDEAINIRTQPDTDSTIVAKLRDKNAVIVLEIVDDGWCLVTSGDAVGYVKTKRLVAGEDAWKIENEVGYKVAIVHPNALNVHAMANDDSSIIDVVKANQELEVVEYNGGAWVKVALAPDSFGYIDASLCSCKTYYPVAEVVNPEALNEVVMISYDEVYEEQDTAADDGNSDYSESYNDWDEDYEGTSDEWQKDYEEVSNNWTGGYEEPSNDWTGDNEESSNDWTGDYEEPSNDWTGDYDESSNGWTGNYEEPSYDWGGEYEEPSYNWGDNYEQPTYDWSGDYTEEPVYNGGNTYDYGYEEPSYSAGNGGGQSIVDYALQFVGNPYVYGGNSLTNGTDCSGFTQAVMSNFDINLARVAADQAYGGQSVDLSDIQAGDLLFYSEGSGISHVAIYMGDGQIVHAATEDKGIIVSDYNYSQPVSAARYW